MGRAGQNRVRKFGQTETGHLGDRQLATRLLHSQHQRGLKISRGLLGVRHYGRSRRRRQVRVSPDLRIGRVVAVEAFARSRRS